MVPTPPFGASGSAPLPANPLIYQPHGRSGHRGPRFAIGAGRRWRHHLPEIGFRMPPTAPLFPSRVLLLGAGWLGRSIAESLAQDGAHVTTVRRTPHEAVPGGTAFAFDLASLDMADAADATDATGESRALPPELMGHDVVIAAVAPDRQRGDDYASTYPVAARAAVRIAQRSGARAIAWVSSTGVYGVTDGGEVTEQSKREATGASNETLCSAEDIILAAEHSQCRVGVFRASGLYGPGRDPADRYRDADSLRGRLGHWVNFAWRGDVVSAIRHWLQHALAHLGSETESPRLLNVSDGTPLTVAECARLVALADGRTFVPPAGDDGDTPPARSNQRIRIDALRTLGWTPAVPNLRAGLERLGYARLAVKAQPYGPQSAEIKRFLRDLAALSPEAHDAVCEQWRVLRQTPAFARADRALGEAMVRANRESERDAAAGPLLQMLRIESVSKNPKQVQDAPQPLDPIAEPALAALMALVVRDVLPDDVFALLVRPLSSLV